MDVDVASGKADLKLFSIVMEDNGVFECRVQIPRDDTGKLGDTTRLLVLGNLSLTWCLWGGDKCFFFFA